MTESRQSDDYLLDSYQELHEHSDVVNRVLVLLRAVEEHDGVAALSEAFVRGVQEDRGHRHVVARAKDGAEIVGVVAVDADHVVELAVAPRERHAGLAVKLIESLREELGISGGIDVWAHGDLPEAQRFVSKLDARRTRELHKMAVSCAPGSAQLKEFEELIQKTNAHAEQLDIDYINYADATEEFGVEAVDEEWLRVNNEAFAWHPEQGGWPLEQLKQAQDVEWFDPRGVLLAWKRDDNPRCVGFHWTKIPLEQREVEYGTRAGEVYVVCVADEARGQGLGSGMTAVGIGYLLEQGCGVIELYVEGDNAPAVATYRKLGFDVVHTDVVYRGQL